MAALIALAKLLPELRKLRADLVAKDAENEQRRFDDARQLRPLLFACEDECRKLRIENDALRERYRRAPAALMQDALVELNGMLQFWDGFRDAIVLSTSENGGTLVWVSDAFCKKLGRAREEIIRINWRGLVHEDDLADTQAAETSAWDNALDGFVNRMQHADGHWVTCRWYCKPYRKGRTIARVEML